MTAELFVTAVNHLSGVLGFATGILFFSFVVKLIFRD